MPGQVPCPTARVRAGDRVRLELPFSEVCMHMRVAGQVMTVEVIGGTYADGRPSFTAQLHRDDGQPFSFPILTAEAGIYGYGDDMYCYPSAAAGGDPS
jgi:hypothetical protein